MYVSICRSIGSLYQTFKNENTHTIISKYSPKKVSIFQPSILIITFTFVTPRYVLCLARSNGGRGGREKGAWLVQKEQRGFVSKRMKRQRKRGERRGREKWRWAVKRRFVSQREDETGSSVFESLMSTLWCSGGRGGVGGDDFFLVASRWLTDGFISFFSFFLFYFLLSFSFVS